VEGNLLAASSLLEKEQEHGMVERAAAVASEWRSSGSELAELPAGCNSCWSCSIDSIDWDRILPMALQRKMSKIGTWTCSFPCSQSPEEPDFRNNLYLVQNIQVEAGRRCPAEADKEAEVVPDRSPVELEGSNSNPEYNLN
jgi:hypothetical protein